MLLWLDFSLEKGKKKERGLKLSENSKQLVLGTSAPTHIPPPCFINCRIKRNSRGTRGRRVGGGWLLNLLFNRRPTFSTDVSRSQRFVWSFRRVGKSDDCKWILDREDDLFNPADIRQPRVSKKKKKIDKFAGDRCQFEQPNTKYFFFSLLLLLFTPLFAIRWLDD